MLHVFVDGSVAELLVGERIGWTKRFYYTSSQAPDIVARAQGSSAMTAWKITPISQNRLTAPVGIL